jgi:hypothetical protein
MDSWMGFMGEFNKVHLLERPVEGFHFVPGELCACTDRSQTNKTEKTIIF